METTVTWYGTATVLVESSDFCVVSDPAFDPVGKTQVLGWSPLTGSIRYSRTTAAAGAVDAMPQLIDLVLVSHDQHIDNFDDAGLEVAKRARVVVTTEAAARRLKRRGVANVVGLAPWQTHIVPAASGADVKVTATPARHGPLFSQVVTGPVIGFMLESPQRFSGPVWFTGDTRWFRPLKRVLEQFQPKTLVVHAGAASFSGLTFSMTAREVAELLERVPAARAVPVHYGSWSHFAQGENELRAEAARAGPSVADRIDWLTPGVARVLSW